MAGIQLTAERIGVSLDVPGTTQSFNFTQNISKLQINNIFVPVANGASNKIITETRNNNLSGFRWVQETASGDTSGAYKLYKFINDDQVGTELFSFDQNGNAYFTNNLNAPNLNITSPFYINYNSPLTALYLRGPSSTAAGFVYSNNLLETILFSASDLRLSSTSGQIHFGFGSGTTDTITLDTNYFKSNVNLIVNNPDSGSLIPEKGIIFQTLGSEKGGMLFNSADNELKVYTAGSYSILFNINGNNVAKILANGNIDLLNHKIINAANPSNPQDLATKAYVDASAFFVPSTISVNGSIQTFEYPTNFNTRFLIKNNTAPIALNPSSMSLDLFNSTNAGYRLKHQITNIDLIGNMKLLYVNTLGTEFEFLTTSFSAFSVPQITINGNFIASSNSTFQYCTFNGDAIFNQGVYVNSPTLIGHAANKQYVDDSITSSISSFSTSNPVTLTGAVTGINSINNPIFTTFASTIPVNGASQIFNFSLNSNVTYRLNNTLAATTGTPSTIALSLNNATTGGYRFLHTSTSTDPAGLGTLKLQVINSSGVVADVFTNSVSSGGGIPDTLFNGTATFNNAVTIQNNQSLLVTGSSGIADYLVMNNTNLSSKTQLRINVTGLPVATFGYDASNTQVYIDSPFGAGSPFVIKFGGTTRFSIDNATGNINLFNSRITNAANPVNAQDYATKAYVDTAVGSGGSVTLTGAVTGIGTGTINTVLNPTVNVNSSSYAFNLNNSNSSGITEFQISYGIPYLKFGVNPSGSGNYIDSIFDNFIIKMAGVNKFIFSTIGNLGLGGSGPTEARLVINGGVQNITNEESALRAIGSLNNIKIELQNTSASGRLYEIRSSSTGIFDITDRTGSATRLAINNLGNVGIPGNLGLGVNASTNSALQFTNNVTNRTITLWETTNNVHQFYGFGMNLGILRYQIDSTSNAHVFYAGTSATTSNELFRVSGNGDITAAGTIYGRRVSGNMSMQNNAVGTTVATAGTYVKVAGATVASNLNGLSSPTSNRLLYTATATTIAFITVSFAAIHNGGGGEETSFALYKNGSQLTNTVISGQQINNLQVLSINTLVSMSTNDYIELWCTSPNNGRVVTVKHLMFSYTTT